ncbi:MAG TPA: hypothetical protein VH744_04535 [Terriglobales bacterium]
MKTTLIALCVLCATAAFGQAVSGGSALSNYPQATQFVSHPEQAAPKAMASQQNLLITSGSVHARGERPLWEVVPARQITSLGETARILRKEHANAKKATIIWEN